MSNEPSHRRRIRIFRDFRHLFPYQAQQEAGGEEEDPGHIGRRKGKGVHEAGHDRHREARSFQSVAKSGDHGEEGGQHVHLPAALEEVMEESEDNERNGKGIEEKKHRNGAFDNGGQTEESDGKRKDRKEGGPGLMGETGQEGVEIGGAGSDEADGGSEAGQDDDESQKA